MNRAVPPILIAEDEATDRMIWELALERAALPNPAVIVRDGQEAVDYLAGHALPCMLLLDLKMPRMDGFDVLDWMAARKGFEKLPVFIFSSSPADNDIKKARQLGAWDYFVKPHQLFELVRIVKGLPSRCMVV
ncbi:MAG TPA: response regulator [Verrucomicrobiae bacterium]|nr:response regulator [Verrucomicrobiae bacterium]